MLCQNGNNKWGLQVMFGNPLSHNDWGTAPFTNPFTPKRDYSRFNPFYQPIESQLLGLEWIIKHQDMKIFMAPK